MNFRLLLSAITFLLISLVTQAQEIVSMAYSGVELIAHDYRVDGSVVGGLSAIAFDGKDSSFYLAADKPPARLYNVSMNLTDSLEVTWGKVLLLTPSLIGQSELEGIAINNKTGSFYVSDEQKGGTRIMELDTTASFIRIIEPVNQAFMPLSSHNSGIEGLTATRDLDYLFYAFERPTEACFEEALVSITRKSLSDPTTKLNFYYQLHPVDNDVINTNGISEILALSDKKLLVMERAYIPNQGNVVRLYEASLPAQGMTGKIPDCGDGDVIPLASKLLFDFATVTQIEIDNAEGMTFNADRSKLYIVTDDNFSRKQRTQIIALDVKWH
jgi:uncharacterized protein YjiK